ncbi:MAG: hypothetical protein MJ153_02960 [Clostridia bacterium]|nr:hypothetical protein [Clostridia bacterium]
MDTYSNGKFNTNQYGSNKSNSEVKPMWSTDVNAFSADSQKCPGCGANLEFNPDFQSMVCNSCGGMFKPRTLKRVAEAKSYEVGELTKEDEKHHEITCNSCGAQIVTDLNTSATMCPFCGSPALIIGRLTRKFEPDYIIPFRYGKEEAKKTFLKWAKQIKFIPSDFTSKEHIEKITGIYIPFWLTDAECTMDIEATGHIAMMDNNIAQFLINRTCKVGFDMIPFDGSKKWDDTLMEAIEPFNYRDMQLFSEGQGYLNGFMAERYDIPHIRMSKRIVGRVRRYVREEFRNITKEYDKLDIGMDNSLVDQLKFYYCLAPVWFVNYEYEGETYQFVMNGQTGKVAGDLPVSKVKVSLFYAAAALAGLATVGGGGFLCKKAIDFEYTGSLARNSDISTMLVCLIIGAVIFLISAIFRYAKGYEFLPSTERAKASAAQYIRRSDYCDLVKEDKMLATYVNESEYCEMMWNREHPDENAVSDAVKHGKNNLRGISKFLATARYAKRHGRYGG